MLLIVVSLPGLGAHPMKLFTLVALAAAVFAFFKIWSAPSPYRVRGATLAWLK